MNFSINYNSVETIPGISARAAFQVNYATVFKEETDITPVPVSDTLSDMPWGGDNEMPYNIIDLIELDETLATCQFFNAEVCYESGFVYNCANADAPTTEAVDDFCYWF